MKLNKHIQIYNNDNNVLLPILISKGIFVDMFITSPPYDSLRTYSGTCVWNEEVFEKIAKDLYNILKEGGVGVWVVNDSIVKGNHTLTPFKQALYFQKLGFNMHDVMIWEKTNPVPNGNRIRYRDAFEYMFILSKGKPKSHHLQLVPTKNAGKFRKCPQLGKSGDGYVKNPDKIQKIRKYKVDNNVWQISSYEKNYGHPAIFPTALALKHIKTWSNPHEIVLDPFMGSGTSGVASYMLKRNFIGIEKVPKYFEISKYKLNKIIEEEKEKKET